MADGTLSVQGYREFLRACDRAGKETKREVRGTFRKVGDIVKADWATDFARYDAKSAAGYRTVVRQRGVSVEQSLRKTTGKRPDFGRLQQRHGDAALARKGDEVEHEMENALGRVADHFSNN